MPGRDDAHIELALVDDLAVLVPAHVELALVLVRPFLGHMVRRVAGARGVVEEEGLVRCIDVGVLNELDGLVGQVDAQVIAFLRCLLRFDCVVVVDQLRIPLVGIAAQETVVALEAAAKRPAVVRTCCRLMFGRRQVPLADAKGIITLRQQHLADHALVERQDGVVAGVPSRSLGDRAKTHRVVIAPGGNTGTRRRAQGRGVHVGVAQAIGGQAVQHGRLDQPAEARQLPVADIVQHKEEHVGRTFRARGDSGQAGEDSSVVRPMTPVKGVPSL